MLGRFLEIRSIGWKDLPARHLLPQHSDGSHVGEFPAQTLVVLLGGGKPHPVVGRLLTFVAENEHNLVLNVDREATEHRTGHRRQRSDRVEHEFMRDRLALLDVKRASSSRRKDVLRRDLDILAANRAPFSSAFGKYCLYIIDGSRGGLSASTKQFRSFRFGRNREGLLQS